MSASIQSATPPHRVASVGRLIVLEGLDGAGTTTQAAQLAQALRAQGRQVMLTREPSDGGIGRWIRSQLHADGVADSSLPWLFAADRADHLHRVIEPALSAGQDVVCDRYVLSSLAYQCNVLDMSTIYSLNVPFRKPDWTVFLEVSADIAWGRVAARGLPRDRFEQRDRLEHVHDAYRKALDLLRTMGEAAVVVDGAMDIDRVAAAVLAVVEPIDQKSQP